MCPVLRDSSHLPRPTSCRFSMVWHTQGATPAWAALNQYGTSSDAFVECSAVSFLQFSSAYCRACPFGSGWYRFNYFTYGRTVCGHPWTVLQVYLFRNRTVKSCAYVGTAVEMAPDILFTNLTLFAGLLTGAGHQLSMGGESQGAFGLCDIFRSFVWLRTGRHCRCFSSRHIYFILLFNWQLREIPRQRTFPTFWKKNHFWS